MPIGDGVEKYCRGSLTQETLPTQQRVSWQFVCFYYIVNTMLASKYFPNFCKYLQITPHHLTQINQWILTNLALSHHTGKISEQFRLNGLKSVASKQDSNQFAFSQATNQQQNWWPSKTVLSLVVRFRQSRDQPPFCNYDWHVESFRKNVLFTRHRLAV